MHQTHMVHRDRAGATGAHHRFGKVQPAFQRLHAAHKAAFGTVVVNGAAVAARHHQHRAVVWREVIDHDAHRRQVVIGVRVKSPVLVPLHG